MIRQLTFPAAFVALTGCLPLVGSGVSATEVRPADGATAFDSRMWLPTTVAVGPASEISVTCDDNLLDEIITDVVNGTLVLRDPVNIGTIEPKVDCEAVVELPAYDEIRNGGSGPMTLEGDFAVLPALQVTGSGPITGDGVITGPVELLSSGSGGLELATVQGGSLGLDQPGSGAVTVGGIDVDSVAVVNGGSGSTAFAGTADLAEITVSGSGGFGDAAFTAVEADLVLSASGSLEMTVTDRVDIRLSGSGSAVIHGDPTDREVDNTGSGSVTFE